MSPFCRSFSWVKRKLCAQLKCNGKRKQSQEKNHSNHVDAVQKNQQDVIPQEESTCKIGRHDTEMNNKNRHSALQEEDEDDKDEEKKNNKKTSY